MNFSDVLKTLNQASTFELYRMRAALDRVLEEPSRFLAIQAQLRIGQSIEYFDPQANILRRGQVLQFRRKKVVVLDKDDGRRWLIPYAAINLDGTDVEIRERKRQGLGRNEVAVGDVVGFIDRDQQQRSGRVVRLNEKTVTLSCDEQRWRVAYCWLHRVVDSAATGGNALEIKANIT